MAEQIRYRAVGPKSFNAGVFTGHFEGLAIAARKRKFRRDAVGGDLVRPMTYRLARRNSTDRNAVLRPVSGPGRNGPLEVE